MSSKYAHGRCSAIAEATGMPPICGACNLGPCPHAPSKTVERELLLALEAIERVARAKGMTAADMRAALRDIREHASTAIANATRGT